MPKYPNSQRLTGRFSRVALLLSASALCLGSLAAPVHAQTLENSLFASIYGGYLFNESDPNFDFDDDDDKLGGLDSLRPGRNGHQIGGAFGVPLSERMDFRAAFTSESFRQDRDSDEFKVYDTDKLGVAESDFNLQYLDLELGYRPGVVGNGNLRLFAGTRLLHAFNNVDVDKLGTESDSEKLGYQSETWGIGPRIGAEGGFQLGNSGVSLFMMGAGSAIFADVDRHAENSFGSIDEYFVSIEDDDSDSRTIYNLEGKVALGYDLTRSINFQIGYQAQQWWNLIDRSENAGSLGLPDDDGSGDFLTHGPFGRITVKLP